MKAPWTPGPWTRHEDYPRVIVAEAEPTTSLLALDMTGGHSEDPLAIIGSDANAALIAAAPDLAEALEKLLEKVTTDYVEDDAMEDAVIAARAALRKAGAL